MESGLKWLRESTKWFIDNDPTAIVLTPREPQSGAIGPGGGLVFTPGTPRASQTVKLISQGGQGTERGGGGLGAEDRNYRYVVVMEHDGVAEIGDTFFVGDPNDTRVGYGKFVVESFAPNNGYEIKFYAVQYGKRATDG